MPTLVPLTRPPKRLPRLNGRHGWWHTVEAIIAQDARGQEWATDCRLCVRLDALKATGRRAIEALPESRDSWQAGALPDVIGKWNAMDRLPARVAGALASHPFTVAAVTRSSTSPARQVRGLDLVRYWWLCRHLKSCTGVAFPLAAGARESLLPVAFVDGKGVPLAYTMPIKLTDEQANQIRAETI